MTADVRKLCQRLQIWMHSLPVGMISASLSLRGFSIVITESYQVRTLLVPFVHPGSP